MRILRLRAYYAPELMASSHLQEDMAAACEKYNITSINYTPTPTRGISENVRREYKNRKYEEMYDGHVIVHRFSMFREGKNPVQRAFRYICCNIKEYFLSIREKDIDIVHSGSTPPTQGMLSAMVAKKLSKKYKRKVPLVYNLQDVFPDSMVNARMTHEGSLLWKIGRGIENYTYKNADRIIVISEGFKKNIMAKGVPEDKIVIVPNWVDIKDVYPVERDDNDLFDRYNLDRKNFYICYSGNIGHSQNLDLLISIAKEVENLLPDIRFVIIGEGVAKENLEKRILQNDIENMVLLPFQDYTDIAKVFSLGDVGLIISKPGIGESSVPSKTWSIMAAGRPVLASFDLDSEVAQMISRLGCGRIAEAGNKDSMMEAIKVLYTCNRAEMGKKGREYVVNELNSEKCIGRYVEGLKSVIGD